MVNQLWYLMAISMAQAQKTQHSNEEQDCALEYLYKSPDLYGLQWKDARLFSNKDNYQKFITLLDKYLQYHGCCTEHAC